MIGEMALFNPFRSLGKQFDKWCQLTLVSFSKIAATVNNESVHAIIQLL